MRAWLDLSCGASGDMLLGALLDAGAPLRPVQAAVSAIGIPVSVSTRRVTRHGVRATQLQVAVHEEQPPHRTWRDIEHLLGAAALPPGVQAAALRVFSRLADAEGLAHDTDPGLVHFHEVGAHDAVADIVGVCAAAGELGLTDVTADSVALGGGHVVSAHGELAVPVPAVRHLLARSDVRSHCGPVDVELCTPTGAALLAELVTRWSSERSPTPAATGYGAGSRDLPDRANVLALALAP